jgi:diguanylate cyclase (GGDEF)-like protein
MTPSLRQRLGLAPDPRPQRERHGDRGLMARSLMFLFFAGASIAALALVFGNAPADEPRMIATAASGFGIAALLLVGYDRLPGWTFPIILACGTMLIEWTIYSSGESTSAFAMFYFWIAIYAFYFFSRRMAALQLAFIACSYAAVLAVIPDAPNPSVVRWAVTTSALVVAGAMIGLLKDRVDRLMGALGEASRTDTITGLLNRRAFTDTLEMELERARRGHINVGLIAIHLHWPSGGADSIRVDRALEMAGAAVRRAVRRIDVATRTGDHTFAVIVPYASDHGAYVLAERIQAEVLEGLKAATEGHGVEVAVGVASFPEHASTVEELRHGADLAVTAARNLGPSRVVAYSPGGQVSAIA